MLDQRDFFFAFGLHVMLVLVLIGFNQWRTHRLPQPERLIQVNMVSLQTLEKMIAASKPKQKKSKPQKRVLPAKKKKAKPVLKTKVKPIPKLKPKKKVKKVVEEDLDYDPFAPLESKATTKVKPKKDKEVAVNQTLKTMMQGQLSEQALNRYIAGMQRAVEEQWKVPLEMMDAVQPALVELSLSRKGEVIKLSILETSGSDMLDETLKKAIYAAAPFQLPDRQYILFKTNKIRFFPLK